MTDTADNSNPVAKAKSEAREPWAAPTLRRVRASDAEIGVAVVVEGAFNYGS